MAVSRILVAVLLVNLCLSCYTSGDVAMDAGSIKSELAQVEKELEKLAVEDAARQMDAVDIKDPASLTKKELAASLTKNDLAEENTLVANDVGGKATTNSKFLNDILDMSIDALYKNVISKKEVSDAADGKESCDDTRPDCDLLKKNGFCTNTRYENKMKEVCQYTCSLCTIAYNCKDKSGTPKCKQLEPYCQVGRWKKRMQEICFKTCGYCRMPSQPECVATTHGCCWDKHTAKKNKAGSNCKECKDEYKYICRTFKADCRSSKKAGEFMTNNCPRTCKVCGTKGKSSCFDDATQGKFCPVWAKDGWCVTQKGLMNLYCKKSCNFC